MNMLFALFVICASVFSASGLDSFEDFSNERVFLGGGLRQGHGGVRVGYGGGLSSGYGGAVSSGYGGGLSSGYGGFAGGYNAAGGRFESWNRNTGPIYGALPGVIRRGRLIGKVHRRFSTGPRYSGGFTKPAIFLGRGRTGGVAY